MLRVEGLYHETLEEFGWFGGQTSDIADPEY